MRHATADYICFSDQDDIWLPNKVQQCLAAMKSLEATMSPATPLSSSTISAWSTSPSTPSTRSMWSFSGIHPNDVNHLPRLLGRSIVTGCASMINRPMLELAQRMPEEATMHDRWIALLAASMGRASILREPLVLYRQHQYNVIGAVATDDSPSGTIHRAQSSHGRREEPPAANKWPKRSFASTPPKCPSPTQTSSAPTSAAVAANSAIERIITTIRYGFYRAGLMRNLAMLADLARSRSDAY